MKTSFSIIPIVVAGVCLINFVFTADVIKIEHPKYIKGASDIVSGRYIIRFSDKKYQGGDFFSQSFNQQFKDVDLTVKEDFKHNFFNGISVDLGARDEEIQTAALKNILDRPDVITVEPVRLLDRPKVSVGKTGLDKEPTLMPHGLTQVDQVHAKGNKGKGVLVCVLDSGIDYMLPALGGGFGNGFKVSKGYDLVGDDYTGRNAPVPDKDPMDSCGTGSGASGHGTHVSGIIAGFDKATNFTGVAPEANLGHWRVFGCNGAVTNDVTIKALLMAYDAGCNVINLSLGSPNAWSVTSDSQSDVINKIASKGVNVVIAAGNEGDWGISSIGQPSTSANAFSVASVDNGFLPAKDLTATGIEHPIIYTSENDDALKDSPIVSGDKSPNSTAEGCTAESIRPDVKGKFALIQRGTCSFVDKVKNAAAAGAIGVALYNNVEGALSASIPGATIPVISLTHADGEQLLAGIKKDEVILKFNKKGSIQPIETAGTVSSFSSVGATAELYLKPNIAGVGGNIYSTLPRYLDSWGMMSGTSMACPYVAGSIALYLNAAGNSDQSTQYINEHFQNYASPTKVFQSSDIDSPIRQGAGLIQVYDTILQKSHVTPAQISFNDTATTNYRTKTITITNHGVDIISYQVINDVSTGVSPYNLKENGYTPLEPAENTVAAAKLRFSTKSFKLGPGKSIDIKVTVTPPNTDPKDHIFYGGYIRIKSNQQNKAKDLKVPYFGVVGVQKTLPIFDKNFPTVIDIQSKEYGSNDTFTFDRSRKNGFPITVLRLITPTAKVKADLIDTKTNKVLGEFIQDLDYLGRNFLVKGRQFYQLPWDGTFVPPGSSKHSDAPVGTYVLRFSALKNFGNPKDIKDWEVWTSGPIVLKN